jgi:tetratricopeptide (TPR) repeat protein
MISDGRVRSGLGMGLALVLTSGVSMVVQGAENDCPRWLAAGREESGRAEDFRLSGNQDAAIDHLEKARDAFAKAMKSCPDSARNSWSQTQSRLAYSRYKSGHFGDACDAYAELLETEPARLVDRALYADALEETGHYKEALDQLQTLILADPNRSPGFYCNMAMIYALDLGDGAQAVETAKKGLEGAGGESCLQFAWGKGLTVLGVRMLETQDAHQGLELLEDAKLKFAALKDDPDYGTKARAEMTEIDQRIHGERHRIAKEKR